MDHMVYTYMAHVNIFVICLFEIFNDETYYIKKYC